MSEPYKLRVNGVRVLACDMADEPGRLGLWVETEGGDMLVTVPLTEHGCVELAGQLMDLAGVRRVTIDKVGRLDFDRRGGRR